MKSDGQVGRVRFTPARSLYIHVPFCRSRCRYCDFFSTVDRGGNRALVDATIQSTLARARKLTERFGCRVAGKESVAPGSAAADSRRTPHDRFIFDTIFVGGGTPTRLAPDQLATLLSGIGEVTSGCIKEWTVEANPESLDETKLEIMARAGVTRLSIGAQSLDDRVLSLLGRPCDSAKVISALRMARARGFEVSADLMTAIPLPPEAMWRREGGADLWQRPVLRLMDQVRRLLDEGLEHVSIYDLIVEEGTAIAADIAGGRLEPAPEDHAADERAEAEAFLAERGFRRYEISNYALPGHECLHNEAYWRMDSWIGAGPGAVSTIAVAGDGPSGALRISEWPDLEKRDLPGLEEWISFRDAAFETMMMAFRTARGLDLENFVRRFGSKPEALAGKTIGRWKERFRETDSRFLALDERGMDLSNLFLSECLMEMDGTQGEC